ncbi:hypothetical protein ACSBR2_002023 [Camellia fascicularis]
MAEYDRLTDGAQSRNQPKGNKGVNEVYGRNAQGQYGFQRSFAEILKIDVSVPMGKDLTTIKVSEEGHGWLYESDFEIQNRVLFVGYREGSKGERIGACNGQKWKR